MIQLFSHTRITNTLPSSSSSPFGPLYYATGLDNATNARIFKAAVYNSTADVPVSLSFEGVAAGTNAQLTVLSAAGPFAMNEVGGENVVREKVVTVRADRKGVFEFEMPDLSVAVLKTE